jgi:hypothetical protein
MLHFSRFAICSILTVPTMISSSQCRLFAMAANRATLMGVSKRGNQSA